MNGRIGRTSTGRRQIRGIRRDASWSDPEMRALFLARLAATCNVSASAAALGLNHSGAYALRMRDPEFRAQWDAALDEARDRLWMLLLRHATQGLQSPSEDGDMEDEDIEDGDVEGQRSGPTVGRETEAGAGETGPGETGSGETGATKAQAAARAAPPTVPDTALALSLLRLHQDGWSRRKLKADTRRMPLSADELRVLIFNKLSVRNKELGGDG